MFTTDETKYNIAPTTATQHRFYAFYQMDVRLTIGTYNPTIEFVPIYNHSFYLDKDNKELQNGFCGVKVTTPSVENGVASDVAIYKAILKGISDGIPNAPADISHILYIDMSSLGATFHSNEKGSDGKELLANFNDLKSKLATNALIFLPQNSTSTFDNFAYKKNGEVVSFQASNDIVLTDKQPFYSPYSIQVDAKNKAKYIREQSAAKYGQVQWASLMLPFLVSMNVFS